MKKLLIIFLYSFSAFSASALKCEVKNHLGSPTLFINDEPTAPFIFYGNAESTNINSNFIKQAKLAKKAGIEIYSFRVPMIWKERSSYSTLYRKFDNKKEAYAKLDSVIDRVLKFNPNALIIPRFYLHPPIWWLNKNPDEKILYSDGSASRISLASTKWRSYVKTSLKDFIKHCEKKYGNNIIGYHPTILNTGECFYERAWEQVYSGFEKPLKKGFAKWVQNKYKKINNLRTAWNNDKITFDKISLPTADQRSHSTDVFFRDPRKDKFVIDFYEYKNSLVADTINFFAEIIKKETNRKKVCITFYGYTFELAALPHGPQISGHLAMKKLLKSDNIDIICSPISYSNRRPDGLGAFMCAVDSVRAAGKLWINEDDTRTYLCENPERFNFGNIKNLQENMWIYNKHFARIFPRRLGTWYMDLFDNGWLNSADIWRHIYILRKIYESQLNVPSSWKPEVAVIIDEKSPLFLASNNKLTAPLYSGLRSRLYRMGTPFSIYLLSDVLDGSIKLPKVNIFLGTWHLEKAGRAKLISALQDKTAVWFYGAGYMDESVASKNNISKLTGFSFKELKNIRPEIKFIKNNKLNDKLTGKTFVPQMFGGMDISNIFQTYGFLIDENYQKQWGINKNKNVIPLAVFNNGSVALASTKYSGFTSIYCGIAGLPSQFFRNVLKNAGVHIYVDSDVMVEADDNFLSVSSFSQSTKSIILKPGKYLFDIFNNKKLLPKKNIIKDNFKSGETKLYWILNEKK